MKEPQKKPMTVSEMASLGGKKILAKYGSEYFKELRMKRKDMEKKMRKGVDKKKVDTGHE